LQVFGGYSDSEQRSHVHLRSDTYYHVVENTLDLSKWLNDEWILEEAPKVTFVQGPLPLLNSSTAHGHRPITGLVCNCAEADEKTLVKTPVAVQQAKVGFFQWAISGVRDGGLIEFRYTLVRKKGKRWNLK